MNHGMLYGNWDQIRYGMGILLMFSVPALGAFVFMLRRKFTDVFSSARGAGWSECRSGERFRFDCPARRPQNVHRPLNMQTEIASSCANLRVGRRGQPTAIDRQWRSRQTAI